MLSARVGLAAWIFAFMAAGAATAEERAAIARTGAEPTAFLRLARDANREPTALETPILRYQPTDAQRDAPTVDLVAAVHIADKSYYEQLNREFRTYDAVLYELVAPAKSQKPRPGDRTSNHPLSLLQNSLKDVLELEFQLQAVDYAPPNMIHADMSPDQFAESMENRGESAASMLVRMFGYAMTQTEATTEASDGSQLLFALFDKNRALALKRLLAVEFERSQGSWAALDGPDGSTLISGRNQVALAALRAQIAAGKRKIAIFYGAAHMPDLQRRLSADFGLAPVDARWLVAWNLKP